jgi:hypothetical protein
VERGLPVWGFLLASPDLVCRFHSAVILGWLASVASQTAVWGPVRKVVWLASADSRRPYADPIGVSTIPD